MLKQGNTIIHDLDAIFKHLKSQVGSLHKIYIYYACKQGYTLDDSLTEKQIAVTIAYKTLIQDALQKALVRFKLLSVVQ